MSNPVELTVNDKEEDPVSASVPDIVVIELEEDIQQQQQCDQQPMVMDECGSENENPSGPPGVDFGEC